MAGAKVKPLKAVLTLANKFLAFVFWRRDNGLPPTRLARGEFIPIEANIPMVKS